jgi:hypothetical protein
VVAEGLACEPEARQVGVGEELGDGAEQVSGEGAEQRRERRALARPGRFPLGAPSAIAELCELSAKAGRFSNRPHN